MQHIYPIEPTYLYQQENCSIQPDAMQSMMIHNLRRVMMELNNDNNSIQSNKPIASNSNHQLQSQSNKNQQKTQKYQHYRQQTVIKDTNSTHNNENQDPFLISNNTQRIGITNQRHGPTNQRFAPNNQRLISHNGAIETESRLINSHLTNKQNNLQKYHTNSSGNSLIKGNHHNSQQLMSDKQTDNYAYNQRMNSLNTSNLDKYTLSMPPVDQQCQSQVSQDYNHNGQQKSSSTDQQTQISHSNIKDMLQQLISTFKSAHSLPNNHEQKLIQLLQWNITPLQSLNSNNNDTDDALTSDVVGVLSGLFQMVYYFREVIQPQILENIQLKALSVLKSLEAPHSEIDQQQQSPTIEHSKNITRLCIMRCATQVVAVCGLQDQSIVAHFADSLLNDKYPTDLCAIALVNLGYSGLYALLHILDQDIPDLSQSLLRFLCQTDQIVIRIVIPKLTEAMQSGSQRLRMVAGCALNRLNSFISKSKPTIDLVANLLTQHPNESSLYTSVLRAAGPAGESVLLHKLLEFQTDEKVLEHILSVLAWRPIEKPSLSIRCVDYFMGQQMTLGTNFHYEGPVQPLAFSEGNSEAILQLDQKDFVASLHRLISSDQYSFINLSHNGQGLGLCAQEQMLLVQIATGRNNELADITEQAVQAIGFGLDHSSPKIRQISLNALGLIGACQWTQPLVPRVTKLLEDANTSVRSTSCWCLIQLCSNPGKKILSKMVDLLKDSFWKVRASACLAYGRLCTYPTQAAIEILLRALRDGSISRQIVVDCFVNMGAYGQTVLIEVLRSDLRNDPKIKEAIIGGLQQVPGESPVLAAITDQLIRSSSDERASIRMACLTALKTLYDKQPSDPVASLSLGMKKLLSFFYRFLEDSCAKIRALSSEYLCSLKPHSELVFIEGLTKGRSRTKRESICALARLGVHNFRALLLALHDEDGSIRLLVTNIILSSFSEDQIVNQFVQDAVVAHSVVSSIQSLLTDRKIDSQLGNMLRGVYEQLQAVGDYWKGDQRERARTDDSSWLG